MEISQATYGKDGVRVLAWAVPETNGGVRDLQIDVEVEGEFLASYHRGDNAAVLPSDSLRRHTLAECEREAGAPVDELLEAVAGRILAANPALVGVTAGAQVQIWQCLGGHTYLPVPWQGRARLSQRRGEPAMRRGGVTGLRLLTTAGSSFTGFLRDALTTQADASDRPLCGTLDASWTYEGERPPPAELIGEVVARLQTGFVDRPSNAIQQLLTAVGREVLVATPELASIELHFASLPIGAVPADLPGLSGTNTYEVGTVPVGITDVTLRR